MEPVPNRASHPIRQALSRAIDTIKGLGRSSSTGDYSGQIAAARTAWFDSKSDARRKAAERYYAANQKITQDRLAAEDQERNAPRLEEIKASDLARAKRKSENDSAVLQEPTVHPNPDPWRF